MPFVAAARQLVASLPPGNETRITLEYFLHKNQGVGRAKAIPTKRILGHLASRGHKMSKEHFQQTILNATRRGNVFIGVSPSGMYLIATRDDAIATNEFYKRRIKSEQRHSKNLRALVKARGWQPI